METERFPVSSKLRVLSGTTIYKSGDLWSAVVIVSGYSSVPKVAFYTWRLTKEGWKRLYKFSFEKELWSEIKEKTNKLLERS